MSMSHHSNCLVDNKNSICIETWQNSTIEEHSETPVCVAISPSQFRSLLSTSSAITYARLILQFVIKHTRCSRIIILIADQIQKYNIAVFEHKNEKRSLEMAIAQGQKIAGFFSEACKQLSSLGCQEIKIITWTDILSGNNYDDRVEHIRQYINNNQSKCGSLIDKVCNAYAQARNPLKHLKNKDLTLIREYVINELPALLNGIQYEENWYTFMLHPTLNTGNSNGNKQREAMKQLLEHMRKQYLPNAIYTTALCHIFDVDIPVALIDSDKFLIPLSTDVDRDSVHDLDESSVSITNTLAALWLTLILQLVILVIHRFWLRIFSIAVVLYGLYVSKLTVTDQSGIS